MDQLHQQYERETLWVVLLKPIAMVVAIILGWIIKSNSMLVLNYNK